MTVSRPSGAPQRPIYLDYAATTPVDEAVAEQMVQCLTREGNFANPASRSHLYGWQAEEAVEQARLQVAELINADSREIVWTSGATEADNLALKGAAEARRRAGKSAGHLIVSAIEHKAVLDAAQWLAEQGVQVTYLIPNRDGRVDVQILKDALREDTFLVSIMHINNEIGSINDIAQLGAVCREHGCLFHVDAAQSSGRVPLDVVAQSVDLMSLSAHKMYGPKGVGALYVRRHPDVVIAPQMHGGGHERGMRSGTLATHLCVGMGSAAQLAKDKMGSEPKRIAALRDQLWQGIADLPGVRLNGPVEERSCGHLNVAFGGCDGEMLLLSLRQLAVATGSACTSATMAPSYVLKAIGLSDELAQSSLRISLGRYTTEEEVAIAVSHIREVVEKIRK
ncbi:IscS subfamily cysteine desulfurase [Marinimicrobium sp. ABcell2]|uniref:IscS subfamily cysteine desulfurase n=1 Tax=Marinimicrobium sp. ABcell2 TaxID=3069751 RepID=UPI0027B7605E|nr:IscS subfamily cysteine desulfurase [Marinimicrobium sp. ABcell2]MDQ2077255.1 IscS subfamily cysteine desulfurase [Marinimicrobium sp. ABcell2]